MLHNTGQYGQNDVPLNVSQPNIMSGRVNIGNNINSLDKIPQHPPPPMNSHFNLPEYNPYGLNMNAGLSQFQNFHPVGFPQNSIQSWQNNTLPMNLNMHSQQGYMYGKPETDYKDQSCSKNMLNVPQVHTKAFHKQLGMDMDNFHNLSSNYRHYTDYNTDVSVKSHKTDADVRLLDHTHRMDHRMLNAPYVEQNLDLSKHKMTNHYKPVHLYPNSDVPLCINKEVHLTSMNNHIDLSIKSHKMDDKSSRGYPDDISNTMKSPESLPMYHEAQLDLSKTHKPDLCPYQYNTDINNRYYKDSRRRSLENTVKMIENIISHNQRNQSETYTTTSSNEMDSKKCSPTDELLETTSTQSNKNIDCSPNSYENMQTDIANDKDENIEDTNESVNENNESANENNESANENNESANENNDSVNENNDTENNNSSDESDESDDEAKLKENTESHAMDESVEIKIEVVPSIVDMEHLNPFHRDAFGIRSEDIGDNDVVDADKSVNLAKELIRNNIQVNAAYFECPHCTLYFNNPKRFLIHTKWHTFGLTNEKRLEVQKEKEMQRYMKKEARVMERMNQNEVTDINAPGRKFSCKDCDKVFTAKAALKNHKQRYHPKSSTTNVPRDCKICGKTTSGWHALRAHMRTHNSDSGYQCADCPKRFKHPHSLAKHRDTHLEKTHECQQCPKKFGSAALLNVHMKTHERFLRGATFRCTYCGKGFFESYSLQVHERTHRNERPYLCEICNTSFGTNSSLKRHVKVSHSTSKPFECSVCHRCFISEAIRERHMTRNHGNPEDFKFVCKQCPSKYMKMKDLKKHTYKAHPKGKRKKKVHSDSE